MRVSGILVADIKACLLSSHILPPLCHQFTTCIPLLLWSVVALDQALRAALIGPMLMTHCQDAYNELSEVQQVVGANFLSSNILPLHYPMQDPEGEGLLATASLTDP